MFYPQKQLQSITIQAILFTWSEFVRIQWTSISQPLAGYGPVIVPSTLIHNSVILCRDCIHQKLASFMVSVEKDTWQGGWGWAVVQMANHPGSSPLINSRNDLFSSLFGTRSRIMNTPLKPHSILKKKQIFPSADVQNSFLCGCLALGGCTGVWASYVVVKRMILVFTTCTLLYLSTAHFQK